MRPLQELQTRLRADLGVMAMKGHSSFPRSPELDLHNQMKFSVIHKTRLLLAGYYPSADDTISSTECLLDFRVSFSEY